MQMTLRPRSEENQYPLSSFPTEEENPFNTLNQKETLPDNVSGNKCNLWAYEWAKATTA